MLSMFRCGKAGVGCGLFNAICMGYSSRNSGSVHARHCIRRHLRTHRKRRVVTMRPAQRSKRYHFPEAYRIERHSCFGLILSPILLISTSLPDSVNSDENGFHSTEITGLYAAPCLQVFAVPGLVSPATRQFLCAANSGGPPANP